jgi:hypothetical protein
MLAYILRLRVLPYMEIPPKTSVFVLEVSSSFPWQDLDEDITRIQSARWLSPVMGAIVTVMPLSWGITLHIIERLW